MSGWKPFRLWLLLAVFVAGQLLMLAHGAEHADADEVPHVCLLCLGGHDLASAVPPATTSSFLPPCGTVAPLVPAGSPAVAERRLKRSARGPPLA